MRKMFDGKKYDTETSVLLYKLRNEDREIILGPGTGALYRRKPGEFFVFICNSQEEEEIIPLSNEAAEQWGKNHMDAQTYARVFGEGAQATMFIKTKTSSIASFKQAAQRRGLSVTAFFDEVVAEIEKKQ